MGCTTSKNKKHKDFDSIGARSRMNRKEKLKQEESSSKQSYGEMNTVKIKGGQIIQQEINEATTVPQSATPKLEKNDIVEKEKIDKTEKKNFQKSKSKKEEDTQNGVKQTLSKSKSKKKSKGEKNGEVNQKTQQSEEDEEKVQKHNNGKLEKKTTKDQKKTRKEIKVDTLNRSYEEKISPTKGKRLNTSENNEDKSYEEKTSPKKGKRLNTSENNEDKSYEEKTSPKKGKRLNINENNEDKSYEEKTSPKKGKRLNINENNEDKSYEEKTSPKKNRKFNFSENSEGRNQEDKRSPEKSKKIKSSQNSEDEDQENSSPNLKFKSSDFVTQTQGNIHLYYTFDKLLGKGTFGQVYSAIHKATGQKRAIKIIERSISDKFSSDNQKFRAEIEMLKNFDHPYILKLYEYFFDNQFIYIVSELCLGGELMKLLKIQKKFTEQECAKYLFQILKAVAYCHARGIVHRDLKPNNILLADKSNAVIKVIDFGVASFLNQNQKMFGIAGTAKFVAPEILQGFYDEKCDI